MIERKKSLADKLKRHKNHRSKSMNEIDMSINNQNSSVIKQPNLIKKPKVETVEENEMSFYAQPVETEKSDKNSSK